MYKNRANYLGLINKNEFINFINYLKTKTEEYGIDYIKKAIKYSLTFKEENSNIIDCFIKFIVVTNFDEIELVDNIFPGQKDEMYINAYLGGLELSHCRQMEYNEEKNYVDCFWFHNRRGLTRTKIGSLMMVELFKKIQENFPGASVFSGNVRRLNTSALEFYNKIGFRIIDINPEQSNVSVVIENERLNDCIVNNEGQYPFIMLDGEKIDYTTYKGKKKNMK